MSNVPKLRFKEFSGEWKEKLLNQVSKINPKSDNLPCEFVYIDLESVEKGLLIKQNKILKVEAPSRAQRLLSNNDILFQTVRPYQKNNYYFNLGDDYVASTGYAQIRAKESSLFLYQKLHTDNFVNKVLLRCTGTSYPAINSTDLSRIKISIPSKQEQEKIASFLTSIDTKIEQLTKKEGLLQQYKKGVMQKIFNQEIRFKADDGSEFCKWEEKKVKDIFTYKNGKPFENKIVKDGLYNLIALNSIDINGELKKEHKRVSINDKSLSKNDLIMVLSDVAHGNFLGLTAIIPEDNKYVLNYRMGALKPKTNDNMEFIRIYINYNQKYFKLHGQGSSQLNVSKGDIEKFIIKLPCVEEQTKIAIFLSSIDIKIKQVQKQLESSKEFKKALFQQMFV